MTIKLSERELSMILNMLTPPYAVSDTHTDEFNELRNKVFYALRDAQNDEPMQEQHKNAGLSKKCRRTEKMQVEPVSQPYPAALREAIIAGGVLIQCPRCHGDGHRLNFNGWNHYWCDKCANAITSEGK